MDILSIVCDHYLKYIIYSLNILFITFFIGFNPLEKHIFERIHSFAFDLLFSSMSSLKNFSISFLIIDASFAFESLKVKALLPKPEGSKYISAIFFLLVIHIYH